MTCIGQRSNQHQGSLNRNPPSKLSADFSKHKLDKTVAGGKGKKKHPARQYKVCAAPKKWSETTRSCKFYIVLLHKGSCFEKYHSIRNYKTLYMQFLQDWVQEYHLYSQTARKNIFWGWTCKSVKRPGNWKHLIARPSTWQCVKNHINLSVWSVEYTQMPCTSYAVECRIYSQYTVLFSFIYNMKAVGDIILIFVKFCRHWNGLHLQVTNSVLSPFLQLLRNTFFLIVFVESTWLQSRYPSAVL
jgi:hypothetical protein